MKNIFHNNDKIYFVSGTNAKKHGKIINLLNLDYSLYFVKLDNGNVDFCESKNFIKV